MIDQKILIFGGSGSLGKSLIKRLHSQNRLLIYSRDEAKHWTIKNEFQSPDLLFKVGDIRDIDRIKQVITQFDPHIILMAAALKQVDTCELSPYESVQTNLLGIHNILGAVEQTAARLKSLRAVLMVSTDKACAPANVYGMCKAVSERIVSSFSGYENLNHIKFVTTRYGNVLDSRGSIIPLFRNQIKNEDHLTVTHPEMTRFMMTLDDSVDLILTALKEGSTGETWVPKIKAMKIMDLANIYAKTYHKQIVISGIRPGEKMHEALVSPPESTRTHDIGSHYIIKPSYTSYAQGNVFEYTSSQDVLTEEALERFLQGLNLLHQDIEDFVGKTIEEHIRPFE
jgi:UDP-N-acetylglucosamine 4,6-dehydratase/5-epimerase